MDQATKLIENLSLSSLDRKNVLSAIGLSATAYLLYASYIAFIPNQDNNQNLKQIPIPGPNYPYIGHMFSLGKLPGITVGKWHKKLGPIINLKIGIQNWILVDDPELAHKIFVTKGVATSHRPYNSYAHDIYSFGGLGISFSQPNGVWKVSRMAALSVLGPKHIDRYTPFIDKESENLINRLIESTEKEGSVSPSNHLDLFSMNVIVTAIFSKRYNSIEEPDFIRMSKIVETIIREAGIQNDLANVLPIFSICDFFFRSQVEQKDFIQNTRDPFFKKLIKEAAEAEGPNVIKSLVEDGFKMSAEEVMALTSDLVIAGTDTTSVTLQWNIAIMCHHPNIQRKVTAEIDIFVKSNGRLPTFKERSELPYCIAVMKECMRFKSTTTFGLPHTAHEDIIVDGYLIPKNSALISSMSSMHMNPDIYPEPEKFIPERFMNNLKTMQSAANGKLEERDHFNFGWGRRICPGIYLAETEIFLAFIQIFSRCFIEPSEDELPNIKDAFDSGLTMSPTSYKVKFSRRPNALIV